MGIKTLGCMLVSYSETRPVAEPENVVTGKECHH